MPGGARAFVLAAGLGTRLRPLTDTWPKPAVPFLGTPLLRRTFAVLARAGVERVALNTHHLPEVMERVAKEEGARRGLGCLRIVCANVSAAATVSAEVSSPSTISISGMTDAG